MNNRNLRSDLKKTYDSKNRLRKSKVKPKTSDDMKSALKDSDRLKRKKKRLSLDWFFRPEGD